MNCAFSTIVEFIDTNVDLRNLLLVCREWYDELTNKYDNAFYTQALANASVILDEENMPYVHGYYLDGEFYIYSYRCNQEHGAFHQWVDHIVWNYIPANYVDVEQLEYIGVWRDAYNKLYEMTEQRQFRVYTLLRF